MTDAASDRDGPPPLEEQFETLADRLAAADGLLFCTDFDGTLAEITQDPRAPEPTPDNRERLAALADRPEVRVAAISGRALDDLRSRLGIEGIDYAGNHGLELARRTPADAGGENEDDSGDAVVDAGTAGNVVVHPVARKRRRTLDEVCEALEARLEGIEGCVVENKAFSATVHYRRSPPAATEEIRSIVAEVLDEIAPERFERSPGKDIVEIDPAIAWDKGAAVELLAADCPEAWLTIYVGDDTTDETAFRAITPDGIGVHVGDDPDTAAQYRVADPAGVADLLGWLLEDGVAALERSGER